MPAAAFTATGTGLAAQFDASTSTGTGLRYLWDFGDGFENAGVALAHNYLLPGTYTVTLVVIDNAGVTATVSHNLVVAGPAMKTCSYGRVIDALIAIPAADPSGTYAASGVPADEEYRAPVTVSDGLWIGDYPDELVTIGLSSGALQGADSNTGTQSPRNISGPLRIDEEYDILCAVRVWGGDPHDQKKVRDRALALLAVFERSLRSDPSLGGVVDNQAYVDRVDLSQDDPDLESGALADIPFTVHVKNLLT